MARKGYAGMATDAANRLIKARDIEWKSLKAHSLKVAITLICADYPDFIGDDFWEKMGWLTSQPPGLDLSDISLHLVHVFYDQFKAGFLRIDESGKVVK